jgi:SAM-dependent methyltransferase
VSDWIRTVPPGVVVRGSPAELGRVFPTLIPLQPIGYSDGGLVCAPRSNPDLEPRDLGIVPVPVERLDRVPAWPIRPARSAGRWYLRTPAHAPPPTSETATLVVADGHAFGADAHQTTGLALEAIDRLAPGPGVDVGCGAGILGLAWAASAKGPVTAVDIDQAAVDQTARSAELNGLASSVTPMRAEIGQLDASLLEGATLLANLPPPGHTALLSLSVVPRAVALGGVSRADARGIVAAWTGRGLRPIWAARRGRFEAWVLVR